MHRLQAGDPPDSGLEVDVWYDQKIGQYMRVLWTKIKPAAKKLREQGMIAE